MKENNLWASVFESIEKNYIQSKYKYSAIVSLRLLRKAIENTDNGLLDYSSKSETYKKLSSILLFFWVISNYYRVSPANLTFIHKRKSDISFKESCLFFLKSLYSYEIKSNYPDKFFIEEGIYDLSIYLSSLFFKFKVRVEFVLDLISDSLSSSKNFSTNSFDPSNCDSLNKFNAIVSLTPCPYALSGKYWGAPNWDEKHSFSDNVKNISCWLKVFLVVGKAARLDGFIVVLPPRYSYTVSCLSVTLANFIRIISEDDRNSIDNLSNVNSDENWSFIYSDEPMFITALGVCYEANNPRHTYGVNNTIFFLQPDFTLRSIDALSQDKEQLTRKKIRNIFEKNGVSYTNIKSPREPQRYIRSEYAGKEVVEWWNSL
ncbi:hypothetical protein FKG94_06505 [Exilibacterium tricleocarpae]|uniref:Uncharacterized protein n=1 Tax=Exilibacterium tricleocarpae TaxID=2591008 RepID=A0A545TYT0_9GAMM|nr:YqcI/YcgG family protein [Exilibacterium tricleocarpae]TQV82392.1 hypothetical protein FKG94_06505 [Exilibacterium tricleocarpae]